MRRFTKRMIFATLGLVAATAGLAAASGHPLQAVCEHRSCYWAGTPRVDRYQASLEARGHWAETGHPVWIKGLPRSAPLATDEPRENETRPGTLRGAPYSASQAGLSVTYPGYFKYRFEAYRNGRLVDSIPFEAYAQNPADLQSRMAGAQANWRQNLDDRRIAWDQIVNVGPL
jgi:hypothetical protein